MKVGLKPDSKSVQKAQEAGFEVLTVPEASKWADVVVILAPDQYQRIIYANDIKDQLEPGNAILFGHGFNIRFGYILQPPQDVDVIMVAPKGPGHTVRREYQAGRGVPIIAAVENDATGNAWPLAWSYAKALGALRAGGIQNDVHRGDGDRPLRRAVGALRRRVAPRPGRLSRPSRKPATSRDRVLSKSSTS